MGKTKFLTVYMLAGISGNALSCFINPRTPVRLQRSCALVPRHQLPSLDCPHHLVSVLELRYVIAHFCVDSVIAKLKVSLSRTVSRDGFSQNRNYDSVRTTQIKLHCATSVAICMRCDYVSAAVL